MPVVAFISIAAPNSSEYVPPFRKGLSETGYAEGQNVTVEYHWMEGRYDRVPELMADLIRRRVTVIVAASNTIALAAKSATSTIPIVFGVGDDPVKLGLGDVPLFVEH